MSRRSLLRTSLVAGVTLAIGIANGVRAQGEGAAAATPPPSREGIAEAKKDFDTIKSVRDAALLPNSRMPTVSVPGLSLPTAPAATSSNPSKAKINPREAKSSNWLVDAMQKDSNVSQLRDARGRDRKNRSPGRERDETGENRDGPDLLATDKDAAKVERDRREQREEDVTPAVVANPLNDFLGSWMTPQDYALLKPGLTPSADAGLATKVSPPSSSSSISATVPAGGLSDVSRTGLLSPTNAIPPPRENPYLQSLKTEVPNTVTTMRRQIDIAPVTPPSRLPPTIATPPATPPPSKIPEFAKPSSDDRYFKQLKRF